ncbi:MAG: TetR family transcriptional regulator, partial [Rubrivivax sp.]|nr:TetR family transcriptional regulator [Rubrivivax sp.]
FLYRDLNDLLSKNRRLETHFQRVLEDKARAVRTLVGNLGRAQAVTIAPQEAEPVATAMVVVLTYWLSYEYVRDPRHALEPESAGAALARGAFHTLSLLLPYLDADAKAHLLQLAGSYTAA